MKVAALSLKFKNLTSPASLRLTEYTRGRRINQIIPRRWGAGAPLRPSSPRTRPRASVATETLQGEVSSVPTKTTTFSEVVKTVLFRSFRLKVYCDPPLTLWNLVPIRLSMCVFFTVWSCVFFVIVKFFVWCIVPVRRPAGHPSKHQAWTHG